MGVSLVKTMCTAMEVLEYLGTIVVATWQRTGSNTHVDYEAGNIITTSTRYATDNQTEDTNSWLTMTALQVIMAVLQVGQMRSNWRRSPGSEQRFSCSSGMPWTPQLELLRDFSTPHESTNTGNSVDATLHQHVASSVHDATATR